MSRRARRSKAKLRELRQNAWLDLPRELSRYGGFLAVLAGLSFLAKGLHVIQTGRTEVHTIDSIGSCRYGAG